MIRNIKPNWEKEQESDVLEDTLVQKNPALILYNDDVNSFDHVIECLVKYCKCEYLQAGQIAMIVHYNGKCDIKHGSYDELKPVYDALQDNHLSVKIEI